MSLRERMVAPIIALRTLSVCHSVFLHDSTLSMQHRSYMGIRYAHLKILFFLESLHIYITSNFTVF